jgi:hypothetical protein
MFTSTLRPNPIERGVPKLHLVPYSKPRRSIGVVLSGTKRLFALLRGADYNLRLVEKP